MIGIGFDEIEKTKLFKLGRKCLRKDFSYDFDSEIFDYDKDKFDSLLNENKEKLFTVTVKWKDISPDFCSKLPGRLLEMEWDSVDSVKLRMVNLLNVHNLYRIVTIVKLGKSIPLTFYDFQLSFMVKMEDLIQWLSSEEKTVKGLMEHVEVKPEKWNKLFDGNNEYIEEVPCKSDRYISKSFSLEDFLFSESRIVRYCTAVDDPDSLDFALTYRNDDILNAVKGGEEKLREYLQTCNTVVVKKKSIPLALSLQYPSYLFENYNFLCKLLHLNSNINNRDMFLNEICLALCSREKSVNLEHIHSVLNEVKGKADLEIKIKDLEDALSCSQSYLSAKEKAEALDRAHTEVPSCLTENWNKEDFVRFTSTYSPLVGINACEIIVSFVKAMRAPGIFELFKIFGRKDASGEKVPLFLPALSLTCKHLFEPAKVKDKCHADYNAGSFAQYFCESTWHKVKDNSNSDPLPILSMNERRLDEQEAMYDCFLKINMLLEAINTRFFCLPIVYNKISAVMRYLAEIEIYALKLLINNKTSIKVFFTKSGMYQLMPESHRSLLDEKEKSAAEAKVEERDNILKTVSHNIKNLIYSVTENLSDGVKEAPDNIRNSLQMALSGARAIQNMVRNIQMAYKYTFEQFLYDINDNNHQEAYVLDDVISEVLDVVVENMFTDEFKNERQHFFENDVKMQNLKKVFYDLPQNKSEILDFVRTNLTRIKIDIDDQLLQSKIGNTYGSLTNIYVLLNEFMMNSFKALAFVAPEKRFFVLEGRVTENELIFIMQNSCCAESKDLLKAEGFGTFIANRIIESIGKVERKCSEELFTLKLVIPVRKDQI